MSYEELKNNGEESEVLSGEHEKVRKMCGSLKRVNAPTNFDFHLKARIANANPNDFQQSAFFPLLRYVLPLSVVLMLAGFAVFSGILNNNPNPPLAENTPPMQMTNSAAISPVNSATIASANQPPEKTANAPIIAANFEPKKSGTVAEFALNSNKAGNLPPVRKSNSEDFGGTRESTSRDSLIINPKGIPLTQNPQNNQSPNIGNTSRISVKAALSSIGIEAEFADSGWKVKKIAANSSVSRSELKIGDLIESADNRKLDSETISEQSLTIKTLNILRDGKRIVVELK